MRTITILLLTLATQLLAEKAPNIIVIYMDDLGWADTSVAMMDSEPNSKSHFYQTPHLEKLAARGMRFSNAYSPAPTCTPSRMSIQFGKTPGRLGYTFVHDVLATKRGLDWKDEVSMADVIKGSGKGYVTAHFGKGMNSKNRMEAHGYDVSDEFDLGPNGNFHGEKIDIKGKEPLPADNPKRMPELQKRSTEFVREHAGKNPFFMMVSHYAVHVPHHASPELIEKYRNLPRPKHAHDEDYLPEEEISEGRKSTHWLLQYAAMIEEVDNGLGAIVEELEAKGELDNTIIIYTSDNGGGMKPNGPLSWGKAQLFEGGIRIPMVAAGPGIKPGVQCDTPVVQWDFLPTFSDITGNKNPLPENLDGGSLKDLFAKGNEGTLKRPVEGMVFHYPCYFAPPMSVIRIGDYKYMRHHLSGEVLLFDVTKDLGEKNNLAESMPDKVAELDAKLTTYLESIDAEDVQDVYVACLEELDKFETQAKEIYERESKKLDPEADAAELVELKEDLDAKIIRFENKRKEVARNRNASHWAGSAPKLKDTEE